MYSPRGQPIKTPGTMLHLFSGLWTVAKLSVISNPALQNILLELRDKDTPPPRFCDLLEEAGLLLAYEASRELPLVKDSVITPLGAAVEAIRVLDEEIAIIAVLRAALPMALGARKLYKRASLGFVAAKRIEKHGMKTDKIVFDVETPYWSIGDIRGKYVVLVDPMLATGSTLSRIIERLADHKPAKIVVISLIATRQGIRTVENTAKRTNTDLVIYAGALDPQLNDRGFIVPGLGDAGDRCFGQGKRDREQD